MGEDKELKVIDFRNEREFRLLFNLFYKELVFYAFGLLDNLQLAEDVVQDFFVNLWFKHGAKEIQYSLKSYLYTSVKNACLNEMRKKDFKRENRENSEEISLLDTDTFEQFDDYQINEIKRELLRDAVRKMPEQRRIIFILCSFEGMKYADVAKQLNLSVNTVRTQMGRSFKFLKEVLSNEKVKKL